LNKLHVKLIDISVQAVMLPQDIIHMREGAKVLDDWG